MSRGAATAELTVPPRSGREQSRRLSHQRGSDGIHGEARKKTMVVDSVWRRAGGKQERSGRKVGGEREESRGGKLKESVGDENRRQSAVSNKRL